MTTNLFIGEPWGISQTYLYMGDVTIGTTAVINGEGPMGRAGPPGPAGPKGDPGDNLSSDPGDFTLIFENNLI